MSIMKRICIIERDDCMREVKREYRYYDPTESDDRDNTITEWLRGEMYNVSWQFEGLNERIDNTNVNRWECWLEDVDMKNGCIKNNYQLF